MTGALARRLDRMKDRQADGMGVWARRFAPEGEHWTLWTFETREHRLVPGGPPDNGPRNVLRVIVDRGASQ